MLIYMFCYKIVHIILINFIDENLSLFFYNILHRKIAFLYIKSLIVKFS